MTKFAKGRIVPPEIGRKISLALKGRKLSEERVAKTKAFMQEHNPFKGKHHSEETRMKLSELRRKLPELSKTELENMYLVKKLSCNQIGRKTRLSAGRIHSLLKWYFIPVRTKSESLKGRVVWWGDKISKSQLGKTISQEQRKKFSQTCLLNHSHARERNGNWRGGVSRLPYSLDFSKELKLRIKERDKVCVTCGSADRLQVHHIDFDKDNLELSNLLLLCIGCHSKVNRKRESLVQWLLELYAADDIFTDMVMRTIRMREYLCLPSPITSSLATIGREQYGLIGLEHHASTHTTWRKPIFETLKQGVRNGVLRTV